MPSKQGQSLRYSKVSRLYYILKRIVEVSYSGFSYEILSEKKHKPIRVHCKEK